VSPSELSSAISASSVLHQLWFYAFSAISQLYSSILNLVIPNQAGIHLRAVDMDSRVRGNDERIAKHR
jgi:hypothetical protein